jgi:hypothetical protein
MKTATGTEHVSTEQLEHIVAWTRRDKLVRPWNRLRGTIGEMNYATRRLVELQMRLPR